MKKQKGGLRGGRGQTLIEVLLAFSASILILSAIIVGITTSLGNTQYTKNQNQANAYAQEGMAIVRKIRDSGWPPSSPFYCLGPNTTLLTPTASQTLCRQLNFLVGKIFAREVVFEHNSDSCCSTNDASCTGGIKGSKVTVKVSWQDSKCPAGAAVDPFCHNVELITCLSNIDQKQSP